MPGENLDHGAQETDSTPQPIQDAKKQGADADDHRLAQEIGEIGRSDSKTDSAIIDNLKP